MLLDTPRVAHTYMYTQSPTHRTPCLRPSLPMFSVTVRPNSPLFQYRWCRMMSWVLASDLQGHCERPDDLPAFEKLHGFRHWTFWHLLSAGFVSLTATAFVTSGSPPMRRIDLPPDFHPHTDVASSNAIITSSIAPSTLADSPTYYFGLEEPAVPNEE